MSNKDARAGTIIGISCDIELPRQLKDTFIQGTLT